MSAYFKTCPDCGANLDPGESCDCVAKGITSVGEALIKIRDKNKNEVLGKQVEAPHIIRHDVSRCDCTAIRTLGGSDFLTIGVDLSNGKDLSCVTVARQKGNTREVINSFFGEEAEWMYARLINSPLCTKI